MKAEDVNFPVEVELKEGEIERKIRFNGKTWLISCCDSKYIEGDIKSRKIPKPIKGFRLKKDINEDCMWEHESFTLCSRCGDVLSEWGTCSEHEDIVRKTWLKIIGKRRR